MDNYTRNGRGGMRVQAPICDHRSVTELSTDFSLPDYQPEIKRLLRVRATVSPPDKYIGAGNADFSGTVDYSILYSGNDGSLYCANETGEYQFSAPLEMTSDFELNDGLTCDCEILPDVVSGRVAGPRKFTVKCRLRTHVRILGTRLLEENVSDAPRDSIQRLCGQAECARVFVGVGEPLQLGDEILCDAPMGDMRVISADAQVFVGEAVSGSGVVNCRGEVCLKLLCCREDGTEPPTPLWRRIPFTQAVPTDGAEVNCDACADGVCTELHVTVEEGRILCEVAIRLHAHAQRNEALQFTRDLYSTDAACEVRYTSCVFPKAVKCVNGNFSLNTTLSLEEAGLKPNASLVDVALTPTVTALEADRGKYFLVGRCRVQVIQGDGEDFSAQEFELPFRFETEGASEAVTDYTASVTPISCRARVDGERLAIDAELAVCLSMRGEAQFQMLSEAQFGDAVSRSAAVYTICYPSRDDTLWSVAKRYHRSVASVSDINSLAASPAADSPESLAGVSYLLV